MKLIQVLRQSNQCDEAPIQSHCQTPPLWMMRQAGRYLPEYKQIRGRYDDFMDFCFSVDDVVDVTLQPIRRFDFDAAIIFSDILVIPHVMGQRVWFEKDHGPRLENVHLEDFLTTALTRDLTELLQPVAQAIAKTRALLSSDKALLGFAGAPWTLLTYMISQGKTKDFSTVIEYAEANKNIFNATLRLLCNCVADLLCLHIKAGADAVQLFESWAGAVPVNLRKIYLFEPLRYIVSRVRESYPAVPIIYYGRGINSCYAELRDLDIAFGVDETSDIAQIHSLVPDHVLQGNLSSQKLLDGCFADDTQRICDTMRGKNFIFNLGHGIHKDTPIAHVEKMIQLVRG